MSAVCNLNGANVGGRPLRIDPADPDPFLESNIRKTGNLLFLLEKARKAAKSALKHRKCEILKQGPFSKAFRLKFFAECFSCLVKPVKASKCTGKLMLTVSKPAGDTKQ